MIHRSSSHPKHDPNAVKDALLKTQEKHVFSQIQEITDIMNTLSTTQLLNKKDAEDIWKKYMNKYKEIQQMLDVLPELRTPECIQKIQDLDALLRVAHITIGKRYDVTLLMGNINNPRHSQTRNTETQAI